MKILHVVEAYGGGVLAVVNQLANAAARAGHTVLIAHGTRAQTPASLSTLLDTRVRLVPLPLVRAIRPVADAQALFSLVRLLRKFSPDVVHLHSSKAGLLGRAAAALSPSSPAVFYSPHGVAYQAPEAHAVTRKLYFTLEWLAARLLPGTLVACSADERQALRAVSRAVPCIDNAVDVAMLASLRRVGLLGRAATHPFTVVGLARAVPGKRPALFAEVARHVQLARPDARFLWIGEGCAELEQSPHVTVTGWLPRFEALRVLAREADVLLQTSASEGLPLAVLEAKAMGIGAVLTDVPGHRCAVTPRVSGYLCADQPQALAAQLIALRDEPADRLRISEGAQCEARERFNEPAMLARWLALYEQSASPDVCLPNAGSRQAQG